MLEAAALQIPDSLEHREPVNVYCRIELKLGLTSIRSDHDLARVIEEGLPLHSLDTLSKNGLSEDEIFGLILPRRTLSHRRSRGESLSREESDRAIRFARLIALAEEAFGEDARAARWLRKPKVRFSGRIPLELVRTDAGARMVEDMILQLDYGFAA